jgi:hypothetical protein
VLTAETSTTADLGIGGEWIMCARVLDVDGQLVTDDTVTATKTDPSAVTSALAVTAPGPGVYRAVLYPAAAGRWTARLTSSYGALDFAAYVTAVSAPPTLLELMGDPDVDGDDGYLGPISWTDADVQSALDSEAAAQRAVCRVPAAYPADLGEALKRRVAVNLARRPLALGMTQGDADTGTAAYLPGSDPEVRRLEGPWRKLVVG